MKPLQLRSSTVYWFDHNDLKRIEYTFWESKIDVVSAADLLRDDSLPPSASKKDGVMVDYPNS